MNAPATLPDRWAMPKPRDRETTAKWVARCERAIKRQHRAELDAAETPREVDLAWANRDARLSKVRLVDYSGGLHPEWISQAEEEEMRMIREGGRERPIGD